MNWSAMFYYTKNAPESRCIDKKTPNSDRRRDEADDRPDEHPPFYKLLVSRTKQDINSTPS